MTIMYTKKEGSHMKFLKNITAVAALFVMGSACARVAKPTTPPAKAAVPTTAPVPSRPSLADLAVISEYYDAQTTLFKQDYLEKRTTELLQTNQTKNEIISSLQSELYPKIEKAWAAHNILSTAPRVRDLNNQVANTVNKLAQRPTIVAIDADYYDAQTNLLKQDYLEKRITELLRSARIKDQIESSLKDELYLKIRQTWDNKGFKDIVSRTYNFNDQIKDAVEQVVTKLVTK